MRRLLLLRFAAPALVWLAGGSASSQTSSNSDAAGAAQTPDAPRPVDARPLQSRPALLRNDNRRHKTGLLFI